MIRFFFILQLFLLCSYDTHLISNKKFLVFTNGCHDLPECITTVIFSVLLCDLYYIIGVSKRVVRKAKGIHLLLSFCIADFRCYLEEVYSFSLCIQNTEHYMCGSACVYSTRHRIASVLELLASSAHPKRLRNRKK